MTQNFCDLKSRFEELGTPLVVDEKAARKVLMKKNNRISLFDDPSTIGEDEEELAAKSLCKKPIAKGGGTLADDYHGNSVYFLALVKSTEMVDAHGLSAIFNKATAIAMVCLIGQILVLNGILFKNFVSTVPNIVSWGDLSAMPVMTEEKIGFIAGLVISPMILLAKLVSNGEFYDIAIFTAQIKTYEISVSEGELAKKKFCIIAFWLFIHAVRAFYLVPLFIFVNAKLMADVNSIMAVLTTNVGLSFLLDLDNDLYAALYAQDDEAKQWTTKDLGVATKVLCHQIKDSMAQAIFWMQMLMVVRFKFKESLLDLWAVPLIGLVLVLIQIRAISTGPMSHRYKAGGENVKLAAVMLGGFLLVYAITIANFHCYFLPTSLDLFSPEECNPYIDSWFFFPNTTKTTHILRPAAAA